MSEISRVTWVASRQPGASARASVPTTAATGRRRSRVRRHLASTHQPDEPEASSQSANFSRTSSALSTVKYEASRVEPQAVGLGEVAFSARRCLRQQDRGAHAHVEALDEPTHRHPNPTRGTPLRAVGNPIALVAEDEGQGAGWTRDPGGELAVRRCRDELQPIGLRPGNHLVDVRPGAQIDLRRLLRRSGRRGTSRGARSRGRTARRTPHTSEGPPHRCGGRGGHRTRPGTLSSRWSMTSRRRCARRSSTRGSRSLTTWAGSCLSTRRMSAGSRSSTGNLRLGSFVARCSSCPKVCGSVTHKWAVSVASPLDNGSRTAVASNERPPGNVEHQRGCRTEARARCSRPSGPPGAATGDASLRASCVWSSRSSGLLSRGRRCSSSVRSWARGLATAETRKVVARIRVSMRASELELRRLAAGASRCATCASRPATAERRSWTARRATARPNIFGLLAGKVVIDQIEIEQPTRARRG